MDERQAEMTPSEGEEDISELRKYIVELMRSEAALMESIKQNEDSVATVNARVKHFKELIAQEGERYRTLKSSLEGDTGELKRLEEKQIEVEEMHRRFHEAVTQRESEVHALRVRFHQQRSAMIGVRHQIAKANKRMEELSSQDVAVDGETRGVTDALRDLVEPTSLRAEHQELRAKMKQIRQYITQLGEEMRELVEKRTKLEAEVLKCKLESHGLRESLFRKEKESELLFSRLRDDTLRVVRENGKTEDKLKGKRRKFRLKTKNEMRSLKRRISFASSELERSQMTNEDTLSVINALDIKRGELEQSLNLRNEQVAAAEKAVADVSASIAAVGRGERNFDTSCLLAELNSRQKDAKAAQEKLEEKQNLLKLLEDDHAQLNAALQDTTVQTEAVKATTEGLDRDIGCLTKNIEDQEARSKRLRESLNVSKQKSKKLRTECHAHKSKNKCFVRVQAKLRRQRTALLKQEKETTAELYDAENLSQVLGEGIQHGAECGRQLDEAKATNDGKQQQMEIELRHQELNWQRQCAGEEAKFQAEVAAWNEKLKILEQQLRTL